MTRILLSKKEQLDLAELLQEHRTECGHILFLETSGGSGIGENLYAICDHCGLNVDLTDYDSW